MKFQNPLYGPYAIRDAAFLSERANRLDDPRYRFYRAMLSSKTYEQYYLQVGDLEVEPPTFVSRPVNADMEIKYAKKRGWIE